MNGRNMNKRVNKMTTAMAATRINDETEALGLANNTRGTLGEKSLIVPIFIAYRRTLHPWYSQQSDV